MKKMVLILVVLLSIALFNTTGPAAGRYPIPAAGPSAPSLGRPNLSPEFGTIPLYFIPNQGQAGREVSFYAKTSRYTLGISPEGFVFSDGRSCSRMTFPGIGRNAKVSAVDPADYTVNYFIGNDPSRWRTDIPTSKAVLLDGLYPDIDLKVYGIERQVEYDWIVGPGGHPEAIRMEYSGAGQARLDETGNVKIPTPSGVLIQRKPVSYQVVNGQRIPIESRFRKTGPDSFGIEVGDYDRGHPLIIDPVVLVQSSYLGGSQADNAHALAIDGSGAMYVAGETQSLNFPTKAGFDKSFGGSYDAFVTKVAPSGMSLVYSTYLGGALSEHANGIAVDGTGAVYVTGSTLSPGFPTKNGYDDSFNGMEDCFVTKLNAKGNGLVFSTFIGGSNTDTSFDLCLDSQGAVYIVGWTMSSGYPIKNAFDATHNGTFDAFLTKLAPEGDDLAYSTFLGGTWQDWAYDVAVDSHGYAYVVGETESKNFPVKNAYDATQNGQNDAFLAKFSPTGKSLVYSTFIGGSKSDQAVSIAIDTSGAAYVTGETVSPDFPTKKAYDSTYGGSYGDGFVLKMAANGKDLVFSTFLGGSGYDSGISLALDGAGNIFVTGQTESRDFPIKNAFQSTHGGGGVDAYLTKLNPQGNALVYSTFLGGGGRDCGMEVVTDSSGAAYVAGFTSSPNFPTHSAYDPSFNGKFDAFVAKFTDSGAEAENSERGGPPKR
jgi:hypothetical protein